MNGYQAIVFLATDKNGMPVYYTNVAMALGEDFCVLCEEAIEEEWELIAVRQLLEPTNHSIIALPTIEEVEGGSVRCMIAEIFLTQNELL